MLDYGCKRSGVRERIKHKGLAIIASVTRRGLSKEPLTYGHGMGEAHLIHIGTHDRSGFLLTLQPVGCAACEEQEQTCGVLHRGHHLI